MEDNKNTMHRLSTCHERRKIDDTRSTSNGRLPTLSEMKVKLPKECFRSSTRLSLSYVLVDIVFIVLSYVLMVKLEQLLPYGFLLFPLYWYVQGRSSRYKVPIELHGRDAFCIEGTLYMALFSIGHDCAHASFSNSSLLNDLIGQL